MSDIKLISTENLNKTIISNSNNNNNNSDNKSIQGNNCNCDHTFNLHNSCCISTSKHSLPSSPPTSTSTTNTIYLKSSNNSSNNNYHDKIQAKTEKASSSIKRSETREIDTITGKIIFLLLNNPTI